MRICLYASLSRVRARNGMHLQHVPGCGRGAEESVREGGLENVRPLQSGSSRPYSSK